jgi:hypothetical protein
MLVFLTFQPSTRKKFLNPKSRNPLISYAVARNRTADLLITNQLLYRLSYNGIGRIILRDALSARKGFVFA